MRVRGVEWRVPLTLAGLLGGEGLVEATKREGRLLEVLTAIGVTPLIRHEGLKATSYTGHKCYAG